MGFPDEITITLKKVGQPRYGENPQQDAAVYEIENVYGINLEDLIPITQAEKLNGKPMSFNNWLDADGVLKMLWQFDEPTAAVFKHVTPAGVAQGNSILEAYEKAWNCDPLSAFGGIAGVNRKVTEELANYALADKKFLEAIVAPDYEDEALEVLCKKKNLRVLEIDTKMPKKVGYDIRAITGGFLIQEFDFSKLKPEDLIYLGDKGIKKPTKEQIEDMIFGWNVARRTRSNTVLLVKDLATIGIGSGQQSRVDAAFIAGWKANKQYDALLGKAEKKEGPTINNAIYNLANSVGITPYGRSQGSVAVSDAFYPFPDAIEVLSKFGVVASLSPAGSIRDKLSYDAMRRLGIAGAHTPYVEKGGYKGGMRAFLH